MKTPQEIKLFEETLEKIAKYPKDDNLKELHLILDDNCEHPEIMFSLVHFLEDLDLQKQIPGLFWFLCGNGVYTDSFFSKIVLKVFPSKHFTIL
nr:Imm30 family immunity protein [Microcystis sp. M112S1]